jgi:cobalamin biosynthesis protein CobD/CbiB
MLAWMLAVVPLLAAVSVAHFAFGAVHYLLGLAWDVAVLYLAMGFKHHTHTASSLARRLRDGELPAARTIAEEAGVLASQESGTAPTSGMVIEWLFERAQRRLFSVLAWFVVFAPLGPVGALLYRAGDALGDEWKRAAPGEPFADFARDAQRVLQWLPARLVAASYAVAGNFEDAVFGWRSQGAHAPARDIVLSAASGAMGLRLGKAESGSEAEPDDIEGAAALIWRALLLWLAIGFLIALGGWLRA